MWLPSPCGNRRRVPPRCSATVWAVCQSVPLPANKINKKNWLLDMDQYLDIIPSPNLKHSPKNHGLVGDVHIFWGPLTAGGVE